MVEDEDPEGGRLAPERLLDPGVAAAADLPVVEIRLGGVHRDDRDSALVEHRVALPNSSSKWT